MASTRWIWRTGAEPYRQRRGQQCDNTVALSRDTLSNLILKRTTLDKAIAAGEVKVSGDGEQRKEVLSHLGNLEFWFNIVTR